MLHNPIRSVALVATLLISNSAVAGSAPAADTVDTLVAQLDDPRFTARRQAQTSLLELGASALPTVRRALDHPDTPAEARARLAGIARELHAHAESDARHITLELHAATPADVIVKIAGQAGLALEADARLTPARIDVDLHDVPAMDALATLCEQHGWDLASSARGPQKLDLKIINATGERQLVGQTQAAGPLLLTQRGGRVTHSVATDGLGASATSRRETVLSIDFAAHLEPRFQIGPRDVEVEWTRVTDAAGRSLLPGDAPSQMIADAGALRVGFAETPGVPAGQPADDGDRLVSRAEWTAGRVLLSLKLPLSDAHPPAAGPLSVAGRFRTLVGGELTAHAIELVPDAMGEVPRWIVAGEPVAVRIKSISPRPGDAEGHRRYAASFEMLRPVDAAGERLVIASLAGCRLSRHGETLRRATTRTRLGASGGVEYQLEFVESPREGTAADAPFQLTCTAARTAVWLDVPFAFNSVPNLLD